MGNKSAWGASSALSPLMWLHLNSLHMPSLAPAEQNPSTCDSWLCKKYFLPEASPPLSWHLCGLVSVFQVALKRRKELRSEADVPHGGNVGLQLWTATRNSFSPEQHQVEITQSTEQETWWGQFYCCRVLFWLFTPQGTTVVSTTKRMRLQFSS